jgi:nucleotide-binding universal stress UspA family protein
LATSLARESGAKLFIVHVEEPSLVYVGNTYYGVPHPQTSEVAKMLAAVVPPTEDVAYEQKMLTGTPADAIVGFADQTKADLIVLSTHGRTGLSRVLMGSVAEAVVRKASCPVLTVKQPSKAADEKREADDLATSDAVAT